MQAPEGHELPINSEVLDGLFTFFLRFPSFFGEARQHVKPDYFNQQGESVYAVLWQTLLRVYTRDRAFSEFTVRMTFNEERSRPGTMPIMAGAETHILNPGTGLISSAFHLPAEILEPQYGTEVLRRFLTERTIVDPLRLIVQNSQSGSNATTLTAFLAGLHRQRQAIAAIGAVEPAELAPEFGEQTVQTVVVHPTGIDFFDEALGGQREGDCNLLLGVTGGGTTTLAAQLCATRRGPRTRRRYVRASGRRLSPSSPTRNRGKRCRRGSGHPQCRFSGASWRR